MACYRTEGDAAFEPRSRRPRSSPIATPPEVGEWILRPSRDTETHDRVRHDRVDKSGTITLRVHGKLRHIGIGRTHKGTHVILLIQDLDVRVIDATTGELLRDLTIDPERDYQPRK